MSPRERISFLLILLPLIFASSMPLAASSGNANRDDRWIIPPIPIDGLPPLPCPLEPGGICHGQDRNIASMDSIRSIDAGPTEESPGWWLRYSPDRDRNGMDDRLQRILNGEYESQSPNSIIGPDGRGTVAIVVDYAWHPGPSDISTLRSLLFNHGWIGEEGGAWFQALDTLDSVTVDLVPLPALIPIWRLPGVVVIEQQNVMAPFLDASVPAMKMRDSSAYGGTMHSHGYRGDGVVIAILDTGVDNEHRSLNDFDDINDDPSDDQNSYDDPKFLGGFDATAAIQNPNNDTDPDDGNGHGTHVAGTALGTGDSRRTWMGAAPGAYLVDVKVLTDVGGTNSQNSIAGLQWCIQNKNNDWGNNDSSVGIDVVSMSLGSLGNPNSDDPGDDGQSAEARQANDAVNESLVVVVAMGNDGRRRVPSPASADLVIAVGAIDDFNTPDRSDDVHASYSNRGPRESDGDDDRWDELKPDVVAPGSDITAPMHGSSTGGGLLKDLADDGYTSMDGTSMATPHVAGLVASMLQMNPSLKPQEIKDLLRNNSEQKGSPDMTEVSPIWDEEFGFGIVDAIRLMDSIWAGGGPVTPPTGGGMGDWIIVDWPAEDGTMLVEEQVENIRGHLHPNITGYIEEVIYNVTAITDDGNPQTPYQNVTLVDWSSATGTDDWSFDLMTGPLHERYHEVRWLEVNLQAMDVNGSWSNITQKEYELGWIDITLDEPTGNIPVNGTVEVTGDYAMVGSGDVMIRIGKGDWQVAHAVDNSNQERQYLGSWQYDWDTNAIDDGWIRLATRVETDDGYRSQELRKSIEVDNLPPTPALELGGITVLEHEMPRHSAFVNSFLQVRADLRNTGDARANDITLVLQEGAATRDELTLPVIEPGETVPVVLYWNPLEVGDQLLSLSASASCGNDCTTYDTTSGSFTIDARPAGVDLTIRPGAVRTTPDIPRPGEQMTFSVRVDNLGASESASAQISIEKKVDAGWEPMIEAPTGIIGSASFAEVSLGLTLEEAGLVLMRVTVTPESDLDWNSNEHEFNLLVAAATLGGSRNIDISSGEVPVAYSNTGSDGHLLTSKDGSLRLHRMTQRFDLQTCIDEFEPSWGGSLATASTGDGLTHIAWTRRVLDEYGFTRQTVSYATIDGHCQVTPTVDLMPGLLLSEGSYRELDLEMRGDLIAIAGVHHDLFTAGTYQEMNSIFTLHSESPSDSSSWITTRNVIPDLDVGPNDRVDLDLGLGSVRSHLMFVAAIDDGSGTGQNGVWYAHGGIGNGNWMFRIAAATNASTPAMTILDGDENKDRVAAAWRVGSGFEAKLATTVTDDGFTDPTVVLTDAPGLESIQLHWNGHQVQLLSDMVGAAGPQIHLGTIDPVAWESGLGQRIASGRLTLSDRAIVTGELPMIHTNPDGIRIRAIIDDSEVEASDPGFSERIRLALGVDSQTWGMAMIAGAATCGFLNLVIIGVVLLRRRRPEPPVKVEPEVEDDGEIELLEEEVVAKVAVTSILADEGPLPSTESNEEEAADSADSPSSPIDAAVTSDGAFERKQRRVHRRVQEDVKEMMEKLPPPPLPGAAAPSATENLEGGDGAADQEIALIGDQPLPPTGVLPPPPSGGDVEGVGVAPSLEGLPPPPTPMDLGFGDRESACPECGGRIKIRNSNLKRVTCPICDTTVDL